jgi:hypothetical protein
VRPARRAAARPAWVRSRIRLRSNSAKRAKHVKDQPPLRGRRVESFGQAAKPDASHPKIFDRFDQLLHSACCVSMSGVWKRSYGRPTKAPPDERGGNRHGRPKTTAPHPDSTHPGRSPPSPWRASFGVRRRQSFAYSGRSLTRISPSPHPQHLRQRRLPRIGPMPHQCPWRAPARERRREIKGRGRPTRSSAGRSIG